MDLKPMPANLILKVSDAQAANIAAANSRVDLFKSDSQKMKELEKSMRLVIETRCESYRNHVIETYMDCEANKVKISKRVAKARKKDLPNGYRWNTVKGRATKTMGDSYMMGGVKTGAVFGK